MDYFVLIYDMLSIVTVDKTQQILLNSSLVVLVHYHCKVVVKDHDKQNTQKSNNINLFVILG